MAEREEEQGWEAGEAERADEEFQAALAEWSGTLSSNKILLTMLASTRLRSMSNVIPKDQTAGPVHGWSICTLVEQAETTVSDRETGAIRKVSISSLTASTLPSRTSDQNDKAFDDAKQEMSIAKSRWHRESKSMAGRLRLRGDDLPRSPSGGLLRAWKYYAAGKGGVVAL
jgi:hypothetical protein